MCFCAMHLRHCLCLHAAMSMLKQIQYIINSPVMILIIGGSECFTFFTKIFSCIYGEKNYCKGLTCRNMHSQSNIHTHRCFMQMHACADNLSPSLFFDKYLIKRICESMMYIIWVFRQTMGRFECRTYVCMVCIQQMYISVWKDKSNYFLLIIPPFSSSLPSPLWWWSRSKCPHICRKLNCITITFRCSWYTMKKNTGTPTCHCTFLVMCVFKTLMEMEDIDGGLHPAVDGQSLD